MIPRQLALCKYKEQEWAELALFWYMWQEGVFNGMRQLPTATPALALAHVATLELIAPLLTSSSRFVEKKIAQPHSQVNLKIKDIHNILGLGTGMATNIGSKFV
ncbi:hypothetical protein FRC10_005839 [Ceratobasidium sp. 414]|nr:hypothetical protein FRC10_005839 [Ceratobasidium sp. 414]